MQYRRNQLHLSCIMKYIVSIIALCVLLSCQEEHSKLGIEIAKRELKTALKENRSYPVLPKRYIKDKTTAIAIAESVLFKGYGKEQIINERPYEVYLINGYWVLNGTIPKNADGGGFIIILDSKNSKILRLTHYK